MIDPAQFARALAERLRPILPTGFAIAAEDDIVKVEAPDGFGASASMAHLDPADAEPQDYADAAWNVLSMVQDVVSESSPDPWPAAIGATADVAEPGTYLESGRVELYFGDEEQPVLRLDPIPLDR